MMSEREFEQMIQAHVLRGWRVVYRSPDAVTMEIVPRVNHVLHAVMTLITFGLWLPIWFVVILVNPRKSIILTRWTRREVWLSKRERRFLEQGGEYGHDRDGRDRQAYPPEGDPASARDGDRHRAVRA